MGLNYGYEKLSVAVDSLATSATPLRNRIMSALISMVAVKPEEDLPAAVRGRFASLENRVSRVEAKGGEGTWQATLDTIDDLEAGEIAREIVKLFEAVAVAYHAEKGD